LLRVLDDVARRAGDGLAVIAVASNDDPAAVRQLTKGLDAFTVALDADGGSSALLGADAIPLLVLIDPDGNLAGAYLAGMAPNDMRAILDAFVGREALPVIGGDVVSQVP
jgi:hypothetical protein